MHPVIEAPANTAHDAALNKGVEDFSGHCAHMRSVFTLATRIWRDSTDREREVMKRISPSFFSNLRQVLAQYVILAACRITDPADDGRNENFTIEMFVDRFLTDPPTFKTLDELQQQMQKLRTKILPARNKIMNHADGEAIRQGKPLGEASWSDWDDFWSALKQFVRLLNKKTIGKSYEIDLAGVTDDAQTLIKSLQHGLDFETLLLFGRM